jgi:negative regulator of flagellin synthesis FlgM
MKINSIPPKAVANVVPAAPAATAATTAAERAKTTAKPEASASVSLSPAASLLAKGAVQPSFDAAKVERVAQSIREGRYTINPDAIADKLISASKLLGGKSS